MSDDKHQVEVSELRARFKEALTRIVTKSDLELVKRDWLSKEGLVKGLFKGLKDVPADRKPEVAASFNSLKEEVESALLKSEEDLKQKEMSAQLAAQFIDLSLPTDGSGIGALHPITLVEQRIMSVLRPFGFENVIGPEIEKEYYCFDSLNIPKHHPARDMQDTFFTDTGHVLRTHTTSVQTRILDQRSKLEGKKLPIKVASPGKAYRNETEDASHQAVFHQFELVWIEEGLTLANLMGLINHIFKELFGKRCKVRFVPKFYPYTEPSIGAQVDCALCKTLGCPACGGAGWVTVGGAGMVHRKVLTEFKFDPATVSGFAFGLGTARLVSQFYNIPKLKMIYDNDLRLLKGLL